MNTLQKLGAAGGLGLAMYVSGPASIPAIDPYPSAEEVNDRVDACAVELGGAAAEVPFEEIPQACRAYVYQKPFKVVKESWEGEPTFVQPVADTFRFFRTVDEEDYEAQQQFRRDVFGALAGATAIGVYVVLTGFERRMHRYREDGQ